MRVFNYSFLNNGLLPANLVNLTSSIVSLKTIAGVRKDEYVQIFTELESIAKVQSVKSSNAIEGIVTSDERIQAIVNQNSAPLNHNEAEIAGYRDALNTIHLSYEHIDFRQSDILRLHEMMMSIAGYEYVTARAIQNRLDAVVGAQNWKPVFRQWHTVTDRDGNPIPSQLCTIQIFDDERHEWLEKTDGAENTDYEPVKGGLSDAMKRAASQWGIGRYLYKLGTPWVDVEFFGKTAVIAKKEMPGLNQFHDDFIAKLKGPMPGNRSNPPQQERQRSETSPQSNTSSGNRATTNGSAKPKISIADTPRYTIRKAVPHRFKSGIMTIMDIECENGDVFTVFCDKPDDALRAGTVLTNLRVSQRPGKDDPNRRFNTLESYRVASAA